MNSEAIGRKTKARGWWRKALLAIAAVLAIPLLAVALILLAFNPPSRSYPSGTLPMLIMIVFGLVIALWKAWTSMRRGDLRRASAWIAVPVVALAAAVPGERALYYSHAVDRHEKFAARVFGAPIRLEQPIYAFDYSGGWQGVDSSVAVFALPEALDRPFRAPERGESAPTLRVPEGWGEDWGIVMWTPTPMPQEYESALDLALMEYHGTDDPDVRELFDDIRALMSRPGSYLGFLHCCARYGPSNWPSNVEWIAIDLDGRRLIFASYYD